MGASKAFFAIGPDVQRLARSCFRKRHLKKDTAIAVAAKLKEQQPDDDLDVYECEYCKGWHVGHAQLVRRA